MVLREILRALSPFFERFILGGPVGPGSDITSKSGFLPVIECNGKLKRVLRRKTNGILEKSIQKIDLTINIT